jgi:hypothetical protein
MGTHAQHVNTPHTIGVLLVVVLVCAAAYMVGSFIREHANKLSARRRDNKIFKTVKEARRDFS